MNEEGYPAFLHEALQMKVSHERGLGWSLKKSSQLVTASVSAFGLQELNEKEVDVNLSGLLTST